MLLQCRGDPYWKVDDPIWTRVQTIHWPGSHQAGRFKCLVSHLGGSGLSHVRVVNGDGRVVAELSWDNGPAVEMIQCKSLRHVTTSPDIWEVQTRSDTPEHPGQLHACYIETHPKQKKCVSIQSSRLPSNFFERLDVLSRLN